jgi:hypothetical protein
VASSTPAWHPPHDPWMGLVQAWPMPWMAPSPYGAPPVYSGHWSPGLCPATGSVGLLGPRPPAHIYTATPTPHSAAPAPSPSYLNMMAPYVTSSLTPSPYVYGPPQMYSLPSPSTPGPSTAPTQPTWD